MKPKSEDWLDGYKDALKDLRQKLADDVNPREIRARGIYNLFDDVKDVSRRDRGMHSGWVRFADGCLVSWLVEDDGITVLWTVEREIEQKPAEELPAEVMTRVARRT